MIEILATWCVFRVAILKFLRLEMEAVPAPKPSPNSKAWWIGKLVALGATGDLDEIALKKLKISQLREMGRTAGVIPSASDYFREKVAADPDSVLKKGFDDFLDLNPEIKANMESDAGVPPVRELPVAPTPAKVPAPAPVKAAAKVPVATDNIDIEFKGLQIKVVNGKLIIG